MKRIQYTITYLGEIAISDNASDEDIKDKIAKDGRKFGFNIKTAADIEWEEVQ